MDTKDFKPPILFRGEPLPPIQGEIVWSEEEIQRAMMRAKRLAPRLYAMLNAEPLKDENPILPAYRG